MYGADLNARTKKGNTPLHICVTNEADLCLHLLLVRGADPTLTNEQGQTPLEYCVLTNRNALVQIFNDFKPEDADKLIRTSDSRSLVCRTEKAASPSGILK
ncbi:unnamed protein product [Dibothriocephalus latus]|uniref:Uncharacterized protein n=1 Tax=Dibothriocephalus latus TaxID=60516 RepID=A0A3P7MBG4_DIBLA|nr:unnamed protein product [Dibothriocephalus latus]